MPCSHLTKAPPTFDLQFRQPAEQPGIEREDRSSPSFKSACSFTSQRLQMRRMETDILFFYLNTFQQKFQYCQQQLYRFFLPFIYKENQNLGQCYHFLQYCMLVIYIYLSGFLHVQTFGKKKTLPKSQGVQ